MFFGLINRAVKAEGREIYQLPVQGVKAVLVPIWYLPGRIKENHEKFVMAAKIYIEASKIPSRASTLVP